MAARLLAGSVSEAPVSFRNDIVPILSKANCNSGGCHGAMAGKGGFRLSLRKDTGGSEAEPASSRSVINGITQRRQAPREQRPCARSDKTFKKALM